MIGSLLPFFHSELHSLQLCRLPEFYSLLSIIFELVEELMYIFFMTVDLILKLVQFIFELLLDLPYHLLRAFVASRSDEYLLVSSTTE